MENCIENAYGKIYLSEERNKEFISIVSKHTTALLLELKEHRIIPSHISLEKTTVRELDYYLNLQKDSIAQ